MAGTLTPNSLVLSPETDLGCQESTRETILGGDTFDPVG